LEERKEIITVLTRNLPLAQDVSIDILAAETQGFTGADLRYLCKRDALNVVREHLLQTEQQAVAGNLSLEITQRHFQMSISKEELQEP